MLLNCSFLFLIQFHALNDKKHLLKIDLPDIELLHQHVPQVT